MALRIKAAKSSKFGKAGKANKTSKAGKNAKRAKKGVRRVLIVAKQNKVGLKNARKLAKLLEPQMESVDFDRSTALRFRKRGIAIRKFEGDLIITVGGDGTFLWTAHQAHVPILPVRIEGQGFLCTCSFKELLENIKRLRSGNFITRERMRLRCTKMPKSKLERYMERIHHTRFPLALNEIAFARKRPSKILTIDVRVDDVIFDHIGDGVMFATPSGSTAYAASAGGSIIDPAIDAISVVPLYPFFSRTKPMIVPPHKKIEVEIKGGDCALVIDGHGGDYVKAESRFAIERAEPVRVVHFAEQNFYRKLKTELFSR